MSGQIERRAGNEQGKSKTDVLLTNSILCTSHRGLDYKPVLLGWWTVFFILGNYICIYWFVWTLLERKRLQLLLYFGIGNTVISKHLIDRSQEERLFKKCTLGFKLLLSSVSPTHLISNFTITCFSIPLVPGADKTKFLHTRNLSLFWPQCWIYVVEILLRFARSAAAASVGETHKHFWQCTRGKLIG